MCASGEPYALVYRYLTRHLQIIVADKRVGTIAELIGRIALTVGWHGGIEIHLGQQIGAEGAVLPVGRAQLIERDGGIDTRCPRYGDGLVESQATYCLCL